MGVLIADKEAKIIYANQNFEDMFGLNAVVGREISHLLPTSLIPQILKTGENTIKNIQDICGRQVILEERPLLLDGEIVGGMSLFISQMQGLRAFQHRVSLLEEEIKYYKGRLAQKNVPDRYFQPFLSNNKEMQKVIAMANRVAGADVSILITGETGTGKGMLTTAIHHKSKRANQPLIKVNCAAIPASLLESELFGYEKGAFTSALASGKLGKFELANGGTIFLDEIGDMTLEMQAKILRVLQEREFEKVGGTQPIRIDVRIIAATNRNLKEMVTAKTFREDLYYRLNVVELHLPPLRERREDIRYLMRNILVKLCQRYDMSIPEISPAVFRALLKYSWPGNIRELENILERAINLCVNSKITLEHLPEHLVYGQKESCLEDAENYLEKMVGELEKQLIVEIMGETGGNKVETAKKLGISRTCLYNKLKRYQIIFMEMEAK